VGHEAFIPLLGSYWHRFCWTGNLPDFDQKKADQVEGFAIDEDFGE